MTLAEHFREFRRRLFIAAAAVIGRRDRRPASSTTASSPSSRSRSTSTSARNPENDISLNFGEATSALSNLISLSIFVGVIVSSPVWLYQIWAFIVPG